MKQIYILVFKSEAAKPQLITGCFGRREMLYHEAVNANETLIDTIWILHP